MERTYGQQSDFKSHLVTEICSVSTRPSVCTHKHYIDWYLLLRVEEDANIDVIRKQYHKYALLLHPDKNTHPKAEVAFKLVSEAYASLSDKAKRRNFDIERCKTFCKECYSTHSSNYPIHKMRSDKILEQLREVRDRFRKESIVIESCIKKISEADRMESPLFNPSNYMFQESPHFRTRVMVSESKAKCYLKQIGSVQKHGYRNVAGDSPVFQVGSEKISRRKNLI